MKSAIMGALTAGLGGHALTHSDIGGYTMQEMKPFPYERTRELLQR
jgi:alpha-glucosidase (family GH31 glycosyl hydrolase)